MLNLKNFSPCVLLAMPQLRDPNFSRAVVLLAEFQPGGAFGFVVNRPLQICLGDVQSPDVKIAERFQSAPLWYGGPVNTQQAMVLGMMEGSESPQAVTETPEGPSGSGGGLVRPLGNGMGLASAKAMIAGEAPTLPLTHCKVLVGHAGWAAQQLDRELGVGAWLVASLTKELIFSEPKTMWERAVRALGVDPATLQVAPSGLKH